MLREVPHVTDMKQRQGLEQRRLVAPRIAKELAQKIPGLRIAAELSGAPPKAETAKERPA